MKISIVAPSGFLALDKIEDLLTKAKNFGFNINTFRNFEEGFPKFLMGTKEEKLKELKEAFSSNSDLILALRGGVGALDLFDREETLLESKAYLMGFSDITSILFKRFFYKQIIGIHGPTLSNIFDNNNEIFLVLNKLINNNKNIIYPKILPIINHKNINGNLIVMNLSTLQSLMGLFDINLFKNCILAIEDINEPHYKVYKMILQLNKAGILDIINGLIIGHFNLDRKSIIEETLIPICREKNLPLFDWPIFGHDTPNYPLYFGQKVYIEKTSNAYELFYSLLI